MDSSSERAPGIAGNTIAIGMATASATKPGSMAVDGAMDMRHTADTPARVTGMLTRTAATTVGTMAGSSRIAATPAGTTAAKSTRSGDSTAKAATADTAGNCENCKETVEGWQRKLPAFLF